MQPGGGNEIEEDQHFLLRLNGPAVEATRVPPTPGARSRASASGSRSVIVGGERARAGAEGARGSTKAPAERTLVARCERPLPNGAAMRLVWGKGIAAASNPQGLTTIEQRFRFTVRAAFTRRVHLRARARRMRRACRSGR